ncbi:S-layer homology domain-containing protein [Bacillus horti]|uniref:SLH domain-containing protein n=1 Tax=Caldalkalibacillus horti TaxID=77523 RepID=A0ABT9VXW3_9BACI|nr:S-layer homology domain-containing protein [Bacillus horti]MDQ0165822.1 hypothetical protein [Bacillus horti]
MPFRMKKNLSFLTAIILFLSISLTVLNMNASSVYSQENNGQTPQIRLVPSASHVAVGETFEVAIWLQGFIGQHSDIEGYEVHIDFDPELIAPVSEEKTIKPHSVFQTAHQPMTLINSIDEKGKVKIGQVLTQRDRGLFSGYGKIGTVTFHAKKAGAALLSQEKSLVIMPDNPGVNIRHTINHPTVTIGASSEQGVLREKKETIGQAPKNKTIDSTPETVIRSFKDHQSIFQLDWALQAISALALDKVIQGDNEGNFSPKRNMTRAEFAKVAVIALGLDMKQQQHPTFTDIKKTDWFYDYVETAAEYGFIQGTMKNGAKVFLPQDPISRAEITAILSRVMKQSKNAALEGAEAHPFKDVQASHWAAADIHLLYQKGLMKGRTADRFAPNENASRAEVSVLLKRFIDFD